MSLRPLYAEIAANGALTLIAPLRPACWRAGKLRPLKRSFLEEGGFALKNSTVRERRRAIFCTKEIARGWPNDKLGVGSRLIVGL